MPGPSEKDIRKKKTLKSKSKVAQYIKPPEYDQRHVATLKSLTKWNENDIQLQLKHNRILQEGFLTRKPLDIIKDALICKKDWLTDIVCPSIKSALTLH